MSPWVFFNVLRGLYRLTQSEDPKDVEEQKDIEAYVTKKSEALSESWKRGDSKPEAIQKRFVDNLTASRLSREFCIAVLIILAAFCVVAQFLK
jgi:hypothetical protein